LEPWRIAIVHWPGDNHMRACFLGQNICALGNGIAIVHAKPLPRDLRTVMDEDDAPEFELAGPAVNGKSASAPQDFIKKRPR
jgi:hypothetical protein